MLLLMEWQDTGIILSVRKHGETSCIVHVLTAEHGRHAGFVHGGNSKAKRPILQIGNEVSLTWRSRVSDQLGNYTVDLSKSHAAKLMTKPDPLLALRSACAMANDTLPERHSYPGIYQGLLALIEALEQNVWAEAYVIWELNLLKALGFGLHLGHCAVTGATQGLSHVSPRTGRAVTAKGAGEHVDKLLTLPSFLTGQSSDDIGELADGFALTTHFLRRFIFYPMEKDLPEVRQQLQNLFNVQDNQQKTAEENISPAA